MKRLLWQLKLMLLQRMRALMLLALAFGFAAAFWGAIILPEQQALDTMARAKPAAPQKTAEHAPQATDNLLSDLPAQQELPKWLSFIFSSAGDNGIALNLGGYHYDHAKGDAVGHYHVDIPVTAEYAANRSLIVALMNGMPFASLDELILNRQTASDQALSATLRMTLNLRDGQDTRQAPAIAQDAAPAVRRHWVESFVSDPFEPRTWVTAPKPVKIRAVAPPVELPPLPYVYLGKMEEPGGKVLTFLQKGDIAYTATIGTVLDNMYRVESVSATTVEFTYLPLHKKQVLDKTQNPTDNKKLPLQLPNKEILDDD